MKSEFKSTCCTFNCYLYCSLCKKRDTCKTALAIPYISNHFIMEVESAYFSYVDSKNAYEDEGKKPYDLALMKYFLEELKRLDSKLNYAVMFITSNKKESVST